MLKIRMGWGRTRKYGVAIGLDVDYSSNDVCVDSVNCVGEETNSPGASMTLICTAGYRGIGRALPTANETLATLQTFIINIAWTLVT